MAAVNGVCLFQTPTLTSAPHRVLHASLRPCRRHRWGRDRRAWAQARAEHDQEQTGESASSAGSPLSRRTLLQGAACGGAALLIPHWPATEPAFAAGVAEKLVGSFLPRTEDGKFCIFTPGTSSTPALRAGNVSPYTFLVPPTWSQLRIANILSGNYCQPKCAEPWIEVKFEDPKQGTLQVVASPMVRLTNKPNQTIEEIGPPEKIIAALGPFVTGDSFDPEEVVATSVRQDGGQTYYDYVLETPYARSGTHNLAAATAKGNTVLLMVVSASDAQWASSQDTLKKLVESFSV